MGYGNTYFFHEEISSDPSIADHFVSESHGKNHVVTILFQNHMFSSYPTDLSAEADHETRSSSATEHKSIQPCK
jgi:hypothetical protein